MNEIIRTHLLFILFLNLFVVLSYIELCEAKNKHESVDNYSVSDTNNLDIENPIQKNSFSNLNDKYNKRKNQRNRKLRKYKLMQKEVDMIDSTDAKQEDVECHKAAVWKCGHRFIRAYKFLDFIGTNDSFEPKCALRTAFFACLKTSKAKSCHKNRSTHSEKFRTRLTDTLWSTRACLLGVKN